MSMYFQCEICITPHALLHWIRSEKFTWNQKSQILNLRDQLTSDLMFADSLPTSCQFILPVAAFFVHWQYKLFMCSVQYLLLLDLFRIDLFDFWYCFVLKFIEKCSKVQIVKRISSISNSRILKATISFALFRLCFTASFFFFVCLSSVFFSRLSFPFNFFSYFT